MDLSTGNQNRLAPARICALTVVVLCLLAGCKSSSASAGLASGQAAQIREQIARLGQARDLPAAGAIARLGAIDGTQPTAEELDQEGNTARGQEPEGGPVAPAGSAPPPLSLPPPPARLGMPNNLATPKPTKEGAGVAK